MVLVCCGLMGGLQWTLKTIHGHSRLRMGGFLIPLEVSFKVGCFCSGLHVLYLGPT